MTKPKTTTATTANDKKYFDNSESFGLLKMYLITVVKFEMTQADTQKLRGEKIVFEKDDSHDFLFFYTEVTTAVVVLNKLNLNNNSKGFFFKDTAPSTLVATIL